jgi:hypothetical protein
MRFNATGHKNKTRKMLKNVVLLDVTSCGSCKNRQFRGTVASIIRVRIIGALLFRSVFRLLVTAKVSSSPAVVTLKLETIPSSEASVHTRATQSNIKDDRILHSRRRINRLGSLTET